MTVDCRVRQYIEAEGLLERGDAVVMGVSGGADSVCLFLLLAELAKEWELSLAVAHIQHGIRGAEAEEDARFVERLCREYGVAFYREDADVPALAAEWKCGEEEAGRRVRHLAYIACAEKYFGGEAKVALGHHRDDVAETVLLSLVRGTGQAGLAGIRAKMELEMGGRTMTVVRPLLCLGRGEIEAYLKNKGQAWRTDATNGTDDYARNRIRHSVMPLLADANPKAVEHIARTAVLAGQTEDFLAEQAENVLVDLVNEADGLEKRRLSALHPALASEVVRRWLAKCGVRTRDITYYHISGIVKLAGKQVGKRVELPDGYVVVSGYETISVRRQTTKNHAIEKYIDKDNQKEKGKVKRRKAANEKTINGEGIREKTEEEKKPEGYSDVAEICEVPKPTFGKQTSITFGGYLITIMAKNAKEWRELRGGDCVNEAVGKSGAGEEVVQKDENFFSIFINYDKIDKICFRFPQSGDRMVISRDGRHKKLTRILIDAKVPKEVRGEQVLMTDGESIVWAVGVRDCPDYFVTEETETVLECYARRVGDE